MWQLYQSKVSQPSPSHLTAPPPSLQPLAGSQPALSKPDDDIPEHWRTEEAKRLWARLVEEHQERERKKKEQEKKDDTKFDQAKQLEALKKVIEEALLKIAIHWGPDTLAEVGEWIDEKIKEIADLARKGRWREVKL